MENRKVTPLVVVHTLASRFLLLVLMILFALPILIFILLPKRWQEHRFWYAMMNFLYYVLLKISFLPITVVGAENIPQEPAVIAANHQSSLDIPLVGSLLKGFPHVWLATDELMSSPILRFIIPHIAILINIRTPITAMRSVIRAIRQMNGHRKSAIIFPEGGRYTDGKIHDFFRGFVILAKKTGRPVIPVRIYNLDKVYPPHTFWIYWHRVRVVVGPAMKMQDHETDKQFKDRVYQWFIEQGD